MKKRRLFIIGASGFGREMESWLDLIPENEIDWYIAGYLDKNKKALNDYPSHLKVLGEEDNFDFKQKDLVILALADPKLKEKIYKRLKDKVEFFTYIAPNAVIGKFCEIGEGSIICPNCILTTNVKIAKCTFVNCGSQIGHDVQIGDFVTINSQIEIAGDCILGNKIFMGSNSMIIPGKKIGNEATIGAGSVVIRNVKKNTTVFGNPAQRIN